MVKNASALSEAGYRVHVVAGRYSRPLDALDQEIHSGAAWAHTEADSRGGPGAAARKLIRRMLRAWARGKTKIPVRLAARIQHAEALHLAALAARVPAQFYLGHCLPGLPAAAFAAHARGVPYGFDAEDFHDAETEEAIQDPVEAAARRTIQSALLPGCAHLTAASPLIGRRYEEAYGVKPATILNVFPLAEAPAAPVDPGPVGADRPARIYWFSQTTGRGRGLESVVATLARMRTPTELHLRGFASADTVSRLESLRRTSGLARPIVFHAQGPAAEMARLAAAFDLGLSTEESQPLNRDICLTNKIFTYLLAGIPQLLSRTTAQAALAPEIGEAAILCDLGESGKTARRLDEFFADPGRVARARRAAWDAARNRFCWDIEKGKFLDSIRRNLPVGAGRDI